jgi:hypothetical protein
VRNISIRVHGVHQYYVINVFNSIHPVVVKFVVSLLPLMTSLRIPSRADGVHRVGYNLYKAYSACKDNTVTD